MADYKLNPASLEPNWGGVIVIDFDKTTDKEYVKDIADRLKITA